MAGPKQIDWAQLKTEYVTTRCSYRQLSEKYGVSIAVISKVSKREKWIQLREQYNQKCFMNAQKKIANKEINRLARLITATTKAVDVAVGAFEDEKQFNRYIITEGIGGGATETTEREFAKVDTKALKDLTGVIKDLTALMRDFYNLPTPAQAESQRIAAERLEMDKRKADADRTDDSIHVVLGDAEEWAR